ncbi:hypothetical protein AKO1_010595 [Acrasis kona]
MSENLKAPKAETAASGAKGSKTEGLDERDSTLNTIVNKKTNAEAADYTKNQKGEFQANTKSVTEEGKSHNDTKTGSSKLDNLSSNSTKPTKDDINLRGSGPYPTEKTTEKQ